MLSSRELQRYSRHLLLKEVGIDGQVRLKKATVLLIGAGGLGAPIGQYLAAAGVGRIVVVDNDRVDLSNLQRQVIFTTDDVGQSKALVASRRLKDLNPDIEVVPVEAKFDVGNAEDLVRDCDLVVDATDNFPTRFLANDACVLAGKPYVYGAIFRFDGQLSVFNFQGGPCYRCLFPQVPAPGTVPNCSEAGVLGVLPGIIGSMQANEALKIILNRGDVASGKLILFDALAASFRSIKVVRDQNCPICGDSPSITSLSQEKETCGVSRSEGGAVEGEPIVSEVMEVDPEFVAQGLQSGDIILVDVRSAEERSICAIKGTTFLPLTEIEKGENPSDPAADIVLHCKGGARSLRAARLLQARGYRKVRSMRGGILAWIQTVDPSMPKY